MIKTRKGKFYSEYEVDYTANAAYKAGRGDWNRKMFLFGMLIWWMLMSLIATIIFIIYKV